MEQLPEKYPQTVPNIVRDYNKLQGTYNPADLSYQIIRDINHRYVTIENSGEERIGVSIVPYIYGKTPCIKFVLFPGEIKHLGINPQGSADQFIWLLNPTTGLPVGDASILARNSNQFVLRNGLNNWFVHRFHRIVHRG